MHFGDPTGQTAIGSGIRISQSKLSAGSSVGEMPSQILFIDINELFSEFFDDVVHFRTVCIDGLRTVCVQIATKRFEGCLRSERTLTAWQLARAGE